MAENTTPDDELIYEAADGVGILTPEPATLAQCINLCDV